VDALPLLDLAPFLADPVGPAAQRFADDLCEACHGVGFAHVTGHGVDPALDDAVHDVARLVAAVGS
jgi:isopenicillin N synthase-like dioxygenase